MTHQHSGELVVFHIGMQINQWWRFDRWLPVFFAMPPMLAELSKAPDSALLGWQLLFGSRGPFLVQYWSSAERLYAYASDGALMHRPRWARFNQAARKAPGVVGIWHETFHVDRAESIYVSTRPMGLGKATALVPIGSRHDQARDRYCDGATGTAADGSAKAEPTVVVGDPGALPPDDAAPGGPASESA
jgi:hypothetical protein